MSIRFEPNRENWYECSKREVKPEQLWISALMIAAEHQGKGYGKAAIQALMPLIRRKGCREIWVGYANDNSVARALYRSIGFCEVGVDDEGDMVARMQLSDGD